MQLTDMTTEEKRNQSTLIKFQLAWKDKDVDALCALMSDDAVYHSSIGPAPGQKWHGQEELHEGIANMLSMDSGEIIDRGCIFNQTTAMARWEYRPHYGPSQLGCDHFEFFEGKITLKDAYRKVLQPMPQAKVKRATPFQSDKKSGEITVRQFQHQDVPQLLQLMKELAVFEGYIDDFEVRQTDLINEGLCDNPSFVAFVAVADAGDLTAMAVIMLVPWTYDMKPAVVMKELYVKPEWRGSNIGEKLLSAVNSYAEQIGASRVQWTVLKTNEDAKRFYKRNGGAKDEIWELWGNKHG